MDLFFKKIIWQQFGAAIEMLENAIIACPDHLWDTETKFWHIGYHTLFYMDYYLTAGDFTPPPPFTLSELDDSGVLPDRTYTKTELLDYLQYGRTKCRGLIETLVTGQEVFSKRYSVFEILLYNMRHVQHHTAQLNLLLRQGMNDAPDWIPKANSAY